MPRYYRRRTTKIVRPKKKWASNIVLWNSQDIATNYAATLVSNSVQTSSPTPTILKVGNFKISADVVLHSSVSSTVFNFSCIAYVLYVPEGWEISPSGFDNLILKHPEWIMASKTMGVTTVSNNYHFTETLNMSTRLKRNLNSGDQIVFYIHINVPLGTSISDANLTGNCRYWTCAN